MNEGEKISRDFEANRSNNTWQGEQSYPKGPVKSATSSPLNVESD